MANASFAEWLLARLTDRSRAASVVGDLLEVAPERGSWFWLSVAGIVLSLTWRRLVAIVAAYLCIFLLSTLYATRRGMPGEHMLLFENPLWALAPYAAICYGFRDQFTQLLIMLFALSTIVVFYWWIPIVAFTISAIFSAVLIAFAVSPHRRKALLAVALTLGLGFCGVLFVFYLWRYVWPWYLHLIPLSARGYSLSLGSFPFLVVAIQIAACAWMHRLLLRPNRQGPGMEFTT